MDTLLNPDIGLIFWTIVTFLTMVFLLKKFAWGPLLHAVEERENRLKAERESAEKARAEAERIRGDLQSQLAAIDAKAQEALAKAAREIEALRATGENQAREEAKKLMEKTRAELEEERRRVVAQLRGEVAGLAVAAAEKLIHKSVDDQVRKSTLDSFLQDLDKTGGKKG